VNGKLAIRRVAGQNRSLHKESQIVNRGAASGDTARTASSRVARLRLQEAGQRVMFKMAEDYGCLRAVMIRSGGKVVSDSGRLWISKPSLESVSRYSRVCRKSEMTVSPPGFNTRAISLQA
jgi:hypothetical protein